MFVVYQLSSVYNVNAYKSFKFSCLGLYLEQFENHSSVPQLLFELIGTNIMYFESVKNKRISISSLLGPYILSFVTDFSCIFISSACNHVLTISV